MLGFVYTFQGNQPANGLNSKLTVDSAHSTEIKESILTRKILFTSALTLIPVLFYWHALEKNQQFNDTLNYDRR